MLKSILVCSVAAVGLGIAGYAFAEDAPTTQPAAAAVCPVSGEEIGSMGPGHTITYEGREVTFCCAGCEGEFREDPVKYLEKLDAKTKATTQPAESSSEEKSAD